MPRLDMPDLGVPRRAIAATALLLMVAGGASAQEDPRLQHGDAAMAQRNPAAALGHYDAALAKARGDYGALWRTSLALVELAEFEADAERRTARFARAEELARAAVLAKPSGVEGRFALARVLGQQARGATAPTERATLGRATFEHASACLRIDPRHPGCLHVLGVWHATVSALDPLSRRLAGSLSRTDVFTRASWDEAERLLSAAARLEPTRIAHALELGFVHAARGDARAARRQFEAARRGTLLDSNDARRRAMAERELSSP